MRLIKRRKREQIILFIIFTMIAMLFVLSVDSNVYAASLLYPVEGHTGRSRGFGNGHLGIDFTDGSINGATVRCAKEGKVVYKATCSHNTYPNWYNCCYGLGTGLIIQGSDGYYYQYAHMQYGSIPSNIGVGSYISLGHSIGRVGSTGNSSGPHLHFQVGTGKFDGAINPDNLGFISHTHSYSSRMVNPTCTAQGYTVHTCSCGNSYTDSYRNALGHSFGSYTITKLPTCTVDGTKSRKCSRCGITDNARVSKVGHVYSNNCDALCNHEGCNYVRTVKHQYSNGAWTYADRLPASITSEDYTIECNNIYYRNSVSSPGTGWTKGTVVSTRYVNSGAPYESMGIALPESATRVLVGYYYYHYCGKNTGSYANFTHNDRYVHYDALNANSVYVESTGIDVDDARYRYYNLIWGDGSKAYCATGTACDGSAGSHGRRSYSWYRCYTYQNRVPEHTYRWTKESGYGDSADTKADAVKYRYRLNSKELKKATLSKDGSYNSSCVLCGSPKSAGTIPSVSSIALSNYKFTYTGKVIMPSVVVKDRTGKILKNNTDYKVVYSNSTSSKVGSYGVTVTLKGKYSGSKKLSYTIEKNGSSDKTKKKNQNIKISPEKKIVSYKKLKKKSCTFTIKTKRAVGKVEYKSSNKRIKISKSGRVTIKKGMSKGTYKIKVKAKGNAKYKSTSKTIRIIVR